MKTPAARILTLTLLSPAFLTLACVPADEEGATNESEAPGLSSLNGLSSVNGLSSLNGLSSVNGLTSVNGMISTAAGRTTVSYIVRCALPAGRSLTRNVSGVNYTFAGQIGVAPEWETGACGNDCQQHVSACVLAHINSSGKNINLWLDGDHPNLGWGRSSNHPYQEGSFFGNIFANPPQAYYCNGKDFNIGLVPGRLGASAGTIIKNLYSDSRNYCMNQCTAADYPNQGDGYKACNGFNHVVTVWRNFDVSSDYKVCNRKSGKCLDVSAASTSDGASVVQWDYAGRTNQQWKISQVSPGKYKFMNKKSGKVMDISGGKTDNGVPLVQWGWNGGANQQWAFSPTGDGYYKFGPASAPGSALEIPNGTSTLGAKVQQWNYFNGDYQQWNIVPVN